MICFSVANLTLAFYKWPSSFAELTFQWTNEFKADVINVSMVKYWNSYKLQEKNYPKMAVYYISDL